MRNFTVIILLFFSILCYGNDIKFYEHKLTYLDGVVQMEISTDFNNDKLLDKIVFEERNSNYNKPNYLFIYINSPYNTYKKIVKRLDNVQNQHYSGYGMKVSTDNKLILSFTYPNEKGIDMQRYFFTFQYQNNSFVLTSTDYEYLYFKDDEEVYENYTVKAPFLKNITLNSFDAIGMYEQLEKFRKRKK